MECDETNCGMETRNYGIKNQSNMDTKKRENIGYFIMLTAVTKGKKEK